MEVQIGVAKINKYASSESGDTLEIVERPAGGLSVVLADGQRSGKSAKRISTMAVRKVISLLAEGVRDGAAARAASDHLLTERGGKVQSTLNILSIDLAANSLVITRNNPAPVLLVQDGKLEALDEESQPIGIYRDTRPVIHHVPIQAGLLVVTFTDGITNAGVRGGETLEPASALGDVMAKNDSPQAIADGLLNRALKMDENRPSDDISVVVLGVLPEAEDEIRRITVQFPVR